MKKKGKILKVEHGSLRISILAQLIPNGAFKMFTILSLLSRVTHKYQAVNS